MLNTQTGRLFRFRQGPVVKLGVGVNGREEKPQGPRPKIAQRHLVFVTPAAFLRVSERPPRENRNGAFAATPTTRKRKKKDDSGLPKRAGTKGKKTQEQKS